MAVSGGAVAVAAAAAVNIAIMVLISLVFMARPFHDHSACR